MKLNQRQRVRSTSNVEADDAHEKQFEIVGSPIFSKMRSKRMKSLEADASMGMHNMSLSTPALQPVESASMRSRQANRDLEPGALTLVAGVFMDRLDSEIIRRKSSEEMYTTAPPQKNTMTSHGEV